MVVRATCDRCVVKALAPDREKRRAVEDENFIVDVGIRGFTEVSS